MQNQEYCSLGGIGWWLLEADFVLNGFNGVVAVGLDVDEDVHAGFLECFHIVSSVEQMTHTAQPLSAAALAASSGVWKPAG